MDQKNSCKFKIAPPPPLPSPITFLIVRPFLFEMKTKSNYTVHSFFFSTQSGREARSTGWWRWGVSEVHPPPSCFALASSSPAARSFPAFDDRRKKNTAVNSLESNEPQTKMLFIVPNNSFQSP